MEKLAVELSFVQQSQRSKNWEKVNWILTSDV